MSTGVQETSNIHAAEQPLGAVAVYAPSTALPKRRVYPLLKTILDCGIAAVMLIILSPLLLSLAVLVKVDSRGPALFMQERIGKNQRRFTLYKFRSMHHGADQRVHAQAFERYAQGIPVEVNESKARFKPATDARITRIGRWLRATHLDELPQLLNVLMGQMSLVGPRPAIGYELESYSPRHFARFQVPAGITGFWQVYGGARVSFEEMVQMDLEYAQGASIWLDLKLMLLTLPVMIRRRGE